MTDYKFEGRIIRLTELDYARWKKAYHAIPDFDAELQRVDDSLNENDKKWFCTASAKLSWKHQRLMAQKRVVLPETGVKAEVIAQNIKKAFAEQKRWLAPKNYTDIGLCLRAGLITPEEADFCGYR